MGKTAIRAGDRAFVKVGRNLVEVRVEGRVDGGWSVTSRTGKAATVKALLGPDGEPLLSDADATPAKAKSRASKEEGTRALSLLGAAAAVLERSSGPMTVKAMIEGAKAQGLWTPTGGKTPEQTLYSAIIREVKSRGDSSRFRKEGRGLFSSAR